MKKVFKWLSLIYLLFLFSTVSLSTDIYEKVNHEIIFLHQTAESPSLENFNEQFRREISQAEGNSLLIFLLITASTLVSEDLTCIATGVMVADGQISLSLAIFACIFGIYLGDILLFLSGRFLGRKALKYAPLKWFISENSVEKATEWFNKKGIWAIFLSRFVPGLRLPTYFAAGIARTNFLLFALYFLLAVCVWTPILVGVSAKLGAEFVRVSILNSWWQIALFVIAFYFLLRFLLQISTWRGRRLLVGKVGRIRYWEFWSMRIFYPPVVLYIIWLAIKFRGLTTFTCANPAIYASGFVGESKDEIYQGLFQSKAAEPHLLKYIRLAKADKQAEIAEKFISKNKLNFPLVLKPDVGERGLDVFIVKDFADLEKVLVESKQDFILQEFADGDEFGVFYFRYPNQEKGEIFAITEKKFPFVIGDGISTVEHLILQDERAVCLAEKYFERNRQNLDYVPKKGEIYSIIDIGTHSRGAIFLDGIRFKTEKLEAKIDQICQGFESFYFGRFDIRTPSIKDFKNGENFKIIELNGVTSEATSIYDRKNSLFSAYRTLFKQWRIAFEIGSENRAKGVKPTKIKDLLKLIAEMK